MEIDPQRRYVSDDDDVQPLSLPLNPSTPIANPRQMAQDTDPFVSPAAQPKVMKHFNVVYNSLKEVIEKRPS